MDDSVEKGMPSIRRFVKMEMAKRGVEMVEVTKESKESKVDDVVVPVADKSVEGSVTRPVVNEINVNDGDKVVNDANVMVNDANMTVNNANNDPNKVTNATNNAISNNENAFFSSSNLFPVS